MSAATLVRGSDFGIDFGIPCTHQAERYYYLCLSASLFMTGHDGLPLLRPSSRGLRLHRHILHPIGYCLSDHLSLISVILLTAVHGCGGSRESHQASHSQVRSGESLSKVGSPRHYRYPSSPSYHNSIAWERAGESHHFSKCSHTSHRELFIPR